MATNIEIKARVKDFDGLVKRVEALCDTPGVTLPQEDTFFNTPGGRLKLRVLAPDHGELIYYTRDNASGPKRSDYFISRTAEPETLKTVLAAAWGVRGVVRKQRLLYRVGNTRIHLDTVEGLGTFMEVDTQSYHANAAANLLGTSAPPKDFRTSRTVDNGHERLEERTLTTSSLLRDYLDWPFVEQVIRLERRGNLPSGTAEEEVVYGLASLAAQEASPTELLQAIRIIEALRMDCMVGGIRPFTKTPLG